MPVVHTATVIVKFVKNNSDIKYLKSRIKKPIIISGSAALVPQ